MRRLPVNRGGEVAAYTLLDDEDAARLDSPLRLTSHGYVVLSKRARGAPIVYLHRWVLGLRPGDGTLVDHIDRDRLNNTHGNLRLASAFENGQNRGGKPNAISRHRGVAWCAEQRCWKTQVQVNGKKYCLGTYQDEDVAAEAVRRFLAANAPFSPEARAA